MAGEYGRLTSITQQDGDRVLVSLPMVGFPPGYQLQPGARVVVVLEENGPAVRPAVEAVPLGTTDPQVSNKTLTAGARRFRTPDNIVRDDSGSGESVAFVIGGDEGEQVVAISRRSR